MSHCTSNDSEDLSQDSCDKKPLPTTKEVLLEHVYAVVKTMTSQYSDRVTGMLADCSVQHLLNLLQNQTLLQKHVTKALEVIHRGDSTAGLSDISDSAEQLREDMGNKLFLQVSEIETELSAQITGMLLELDIPTLEHLLEDHESLEKAVSQAKRKYLQTHHPQSLPSKEDLGNILHELVKQIHPEEAAKITGMLLELSSETIHELLDSPTQLEAKVDQAYQVIFDFQE